MTDEGYKGQPDYVVVGFLSDLFEPWANIDGSEWGDFISSLHHLIEACITVSEEERAGVLCGWFLEEMNPSIDDLVQSGYEEGIWEAQDEYEGVVAHWRERAKSFKGEDALETTIADLPAWIRPDPNRPPRPDPEVREYERLKKKFEGIGNG